MQVGSRNVVGTLFTRRILAAAALAALSSSAFAVNGTWTNTNGGNFTDTANWAGGIVASTADALADFSTIDWDDTLVTPTAGLAPIQVDTAVTLGSLQFGDSTPATIGGVQFSSTAGNIMTLTGVTPTITNNLPVGAVARIDNVMTGTNLTYTGAGETHVTAVNTFTGTITMNNANVRVGTGNAVAGRLAAVSTTLALTGTNTISNGQSISGTLVMQHNIVANAGSVTTFNLGNRSEIGQKSSGGGLSYAVTGTGDIKFIMSTNTARNDFYAQMNAFAGSLTFDAPNQVLGTDGVTMVSPLGRLLANGGFWNGFAAAKVNIEGFAQLQAATNSGGNTWSIGALSGTSATAGFNGATAGTANYSIGGLNLDTSFAGLFAGNVAVTKVGTGKLTLSRSQFHTGATNINAGTLVLTGAANLGNAGLTSFSSTISIAGGATLDVAGLATPFTTVIGVDALGAPVNQTLQTAAGATAANIVGAADFTGGNVNIGTLTGAGTLAVNGNLGFSGATLNMELSPNLAPGGTNDLITVTGATALNSGTLNLGLLGGLSAGTYTLIQSAGGFTGSPSNLTFNFGARGTPPALVVNGNALQVNVTSTAGAAIVWKGNVDGNWNVNQTANWLNGAASDKFYQLDAVTFDDTATLFNVNLNGSLAPSSVTMNNTTDYTFGGTGGINGSGLFTKKGTGKLTLNTTTNGFTGGLKIEAGTVDALTAGGVNLGTGTITLDGGTLRAITPSGSNVTIANAIAVNGAATFITANSGTTARQTILSGPITGAGTLTITNDNVASVKGLDIGNSTGFTGTMNVGTAFAMRITSTANGNPAMTLNIDAGGSVGSINGSPVVMDIGRLTGSGTLRGHQSSGNGSTAEFRIGGTALSSTFDGVVTDGAQGATVRPVLITKVGTGTLTLNGINTYTGRTTLQAGTLELGVNAQQPVLGGATVTTPNGADIQGGKLVLKYADATAGAALSTQVSGILDTGFDQATKFSTGLLRSTTLATGRTLGWRDNAGSSQVEVAYTLPGDADLSYAVNFDDLLALAQNYSTTATGKVWSQGDFNYDQSVNFDDLLALAQNYNASLSGSQQELLGASFAADYALALSLVPEPTSLAAVGLGAMLLRRRR